MYAFSCVQYHFNYGNRCQDEMIFIWSVISEDKTINYQYRNEMKGKNYSGILFVLDACSG